MNNNITKKEMAGLVFTDIVKQSLVNLLKTNYGVSDINFKDMNYGLSMEINGSDRFYFIKNAIVKTSGVDLNTISILSENLDKKKALYAYLPEKDKNLLKRLKRIK